MATTEKDLLARLLAMRLQGQQQDVTTVAPPAAQRPPATPLELRGMANVAMNLYEGLRSAVNENPLTPFRLPDMGESASPMPLTQTASYTLGSLLPDISDPITGPFGELAKAGFKALPAGMLFAAPNGDWLRKAREVMARFTPSHMGPLHAEALVDKAKDPLHRLGLVNEAYHSPATTSVAPSQTIGGPRKPSEGEFLNELREPVGGLGVIRKDAWPYYLRDHGRDISDYLAPHEVGPARLKKFFGGRPYASLFTIAALRGQNPHTKGGGSDFIKLLWEVESGETTVENAAYLLQISPDFLTPRNIASAIKDSKAFAREGLQLLGIDLERPLLVWRGGRLPITGTPIPVSLSRGVAGSFDYSGTGARPYVVDPKRIQADVEYAIGNMAREREVLVFPKDLHPVTVADAGGAVYIKPEDNGLFSVAVRQNRDQYDYAWVQETRAEGYRYSPELSMSIAQTVPGKEFFPLVPGQVRPTERPILGMQRKIAQQQYNAMNPMLSLQQPQLVEQPLSLEMLLAHGPGKP